MAAKAFTFRQHECAPTDFNSKADESLSVILDKSGASEYGVAQMGWEQRGNNQYYYKKEREGSRVKSVYVGRGEIAHMVAQLQSSSPLLERFARTMKSPQQVQQEKAEAALDELDDRISLVTQATLLAAGFHTHKRQWRKMRQ